MAEPELPDPTSSYSDPVYDRLESVKSTMARRWPLIVITAIIAAVVVVIMQQNLQSQPEAASAASYLSAQADGNDALRALSNDESITPRFRVRAAIEVASEALKSGNADQAREILSAVAPVAQQAVDQGLDLSLQLSLAAIDEQTGQLELARSAYQAVELEAANTFPAHGLQAALGQARSLTLLADGSEDPQAAASYRADALRLYDSISQRRLAGAEQLIDIARVQAANLTRLYPELTAQE